jgi:HMG box factor
MDSLLSPSTDHKRRRYNPELQLKHAYPSPSPVSFSPSQPYSRGGVTMPGTSYQAHQSPAYSRAQITRAAPQQYASHSSSFNDSLRLPPLQTQFPGGPGGNTTTHKTDLGAEARANQAKSIEAMVMTIPYTNKIKVLAKISPPLMAAGVDSPVQQVRGAVIAVEGADRALLVEVGALLNEYLRRDDSCAVRTWAISNPSRIGSVHNGDEGMVGICSTSIDPLIATPQTTTGNSFIEYLSIISEWHKRSPEIIQHITTTPSPSSPSLSCTPKIPIALLPHGFSLTTSDAHALRIPINDAYAPVDHWQWMATLWRGIVGPDLTVLVKRVEDHEKMERHGGGVEIRADCAAIVVRVLPGRRVEEKVARRLGFEVLEFVRGVEGALI